MSDLEIRAITAAEQQEAVRLLSLLNPQVPPSCLAERLAAVFSDHPHYTCLGAFVENRLVGVAGAWVATKIWCGRYLEIDNIIVDPEARSLGIGSRLIQDLEAMAKARGCTVLAIDSYSTNHASHRLYHRLGFEIWSFHFIKAIGDWKGQDTLPAVRDDP